MNNYDLIVNQFKKLVKKSLYNYRIDIYRRNKKLQDREMFIDNNIALEFCDEYSFFENRL